MDGDTIYLGDLIQNLPIGVNMTELQRETWTEKRERWTGYRFTNSSQALPIAQLFNATKYSVTDEYSVDSHILKLELTISQYNPKTSTYDAVDTLVINRGDFIRDEPFSVPTVIPYKELTERMEPEKLVEYQLHQAHQ